MSLSRESRQFNRSGGFPFTGLLSAVRFVFTTRLQSAPALPLLVILAALLGMLPGIGPLAGNALAATMPAPEVSDVPDDWGSSLDITWEPPLDVERYEIWRLETEPGSAAAMPALPDSALAAADTSALSGFLESRSWTMAGEPGFDDTLFSDCGLSHDRQYQYQLIAFGSQGATAFGVTPPQAPVRQWIKHSTFNILVAVIAFLASVLILVARARRGAKLFIRRIAGLEAVEEAVGRATEMGRPILYIPGLDPMDEVATVAAINILGQVAKKAGEYETRLVVPNRDPIVMAVAQQVVRESYSAVGKPHLYRQEDVFYVTYSQFGFAAAVAGLMMRDRPATNFFMGHFYAESLVLAETGNATGAIQIAGTDSDAQLPFFITACDYTLIGEELYAGSVYLSREPLLLGTLKAQDYAKAVIIIAMLAGIVLLSINPELGESFRSLFR
jgi:hypothetical protein